jgi:hypothetical protein
VNSTDLVGIPKRDHGELGTAPKPGCVSCDCRGNARPRAILESPRGPAQCRLPCLPLAAFRIYSDRPYNLNTSPPVEANGATGAGGPRSAGRHWVLAYPAVVPSAGGGPARLGRAIPPQQDVGPAQLVDEEHLRGPGPYAPDGGQRGNDLVVGKPMCRTMPAKSSEPERPPSPGMNGSGRPWMPTRRERAASEAARAS